MQFKYNFPRYTYFDYINWKEDWELIDGYPMQFLPSATFSHNKVQGNLYFQGKLSLSKNDENCNCEIVSELDWKIAIDTVVRPDLMVVCQEITTDYLETTPVLIVEVVSKSSVNRDRVIKFDLYREQGVNFYLIVLSKDYNLTKNK